MPNQDFFPFIIDCAPFGVLVFSQEKIEFLNPACEKISGYTQKDLQKSHLGFLKYVHPEDIKLLKKRLQARKDGKSIPRSFQVRILGKNKKTKIIECYTCPVPGYKGFSIGIIRDITQQKLDDERLHESETKYNDLVVKFNTTFSRLRHALNGTIQAISSVLETRDPFSAGHQRRVSDLARAIATELGLSDEQIDIIRLAGTLHDIGKVAIPAGILNKSAALNSFERELVNMHPRVGYDILERIDLPWALSDIVFQHHERLDGSGYPLGLKEDQILLASKILAVADVTEAMISARSYRPAQSLEAALSELSQNKGRLYDAKAVDACIKLFKEKKFVFDRHYNAEHLT